jgi:cyclic pyranopterin phosphate synthase
MMVQPVSDLLGRPLEALRISVTDRCNLRCTYCMPKAMFAGHTFLGHDELLSFDEIALLAEIFTQLGVRKVRLTGGEPLLRPGIEELVARLAHIPELTELALSTNGLLLRQHAAGLRKAGLARINLSLDAIEDEVFGAINGLGKPAAAVLDGIEAALEEGFAVKVNMVVQRGVNEGQIVPMARHFAARNVPLRFIEFMDVGNCNDWKPEHVVPGAEILQMLRGEFELEPETQNVADTDRRFRCRRTGARFGFVNSVTAPFCRNCNRLRLSADGRIFTCLFSREGFSIGKLLRGGAGRDEIAGTIRTLWQKREDRYSELRALPEKKTTQRKIEMSYIGG